jgi:hypothetical protein
MHSLPLALLLLSTGIAVPQAMTSLSAEVQHVAAIVGLDPIASAMDGTEGGAAVDRQRRIERVIACVLDADVAIAGINNEISDLQLEQARLQARSDARVKTLAIAGIVFAAGGLVGELFEFDASKETLGSIIESVAAAVGIVAGAFALREEHHGRTRQDVQYNMLAQMLDRPAMATSTYPDVVWKYLNSAGAGSAGVTPRQQLLTDWSRNKLLGKKGRDEATIDSLTSTHAGTTTHRRLTIDEIEDRVSMLTDTAAHIALFKKALRGLMTEPDGLAISPGLYNPVQGSESR